MITPDVRDLLDAIRNLLALPHPLDPDDRLYAQVLERRVAALRGVIAGTLDTADLPGTDVEGTVRTIRGVADRHPVAYATSDDPSRGVR